MPEFATSSRLRTIIIIAVLLIMSSFTVMAGATIAPALPAMRLAFTDQAYADELIQFVLTAPALFIALGAGFAGLIVDRFGRKPPLIAGLVLYGLAGTSGLFLDDIYAILVGRALLGVAVAAIMTVCTTLIADYFEGDQRQRIMGFQGAFMAFGGVFFLTGGGALADISWRAPFIIYAAAFLVLIPAVIFIYEPPQHERSEDDPGEPIIAHLNPEQTSQVRLLYATALVSMICFYLVPVQFPFYIKALGVTANVYTGIAMASMTMTSAIVASQYQKIRARLSFRAIFALLFAAQGAGFVLLYFAETYAVAVAALVLAGAGLGLLMPNLSVYLVSFMPESVRGRAVGGLTASVFAGQFLSPFPAQLLRGTTGLGGVFALAGGVLFLMAALYAGGTGTPKAPVPPA